jgi:hypothetical protein
MMWVLLRIRLFSRVPFARPLSPYASQSRTASATVPGDWTSTLLNVGDLAQPDGYHLRRRRGLIRLGDPDDTDRLPGA